MFSKIQIKQADSKINKWRKLLNDSFPSAGWVNYIRSALFMTTSQLAQRCGYHQTRISRIEKDEKNGSVNLKTMKKVAEGLDSYFIYAIVPKKEIEGMLKNRAIEIARKQVAITNKTMSLEDQSV